MRELLQRAVNAAHHHRVRLPRTERVAGALAARIGRARSLLDVGCGDGTVAQSIAEKVGAERVAGVDVKVQPGAPLEVTEYDGLHLPFPDRSFEAVVLSDMLHHCHDPAAVLREALRVAGRVVAVKDHFRFGPVSEKILLWMDLVGNASHGIHVRGTYFGPGEWADLVARAGGRFTGLEWPLQIHDLPFRLVTQDRLQFAAGIARSTMGAPPSSPREAS
jgi:SAM-dependent methyltransferase